MKFKGQIFLSAVIAVLFISTYYPHYDASEKEAVLIQALTNGLNQLHFKPATIDDEFSKKAFHLYLDRIDGGKRWLTQQDVDQLDAFELFVDDQIRTAHFDFFDASVKLIENGISKTQKFYREILAQPFDFSEDTEIETDGDKKAYAKNDAELKEYWRKSLKYATLSEYVSKVEAQEKRLKKENEGKEMVNVSEAKDEVKNKEDKEDEPIKTMKELEADARAAVLKRYDRWYDRLQKERRTDRLTSYFNALTNIYDPHTSYFAPRDKEQFDISMSGTLEGIGARLQTDGDYTKITSIVPGGPAWKQKDLEPDDVIQKVTQESGEAEDITGWRIDDVVSKIRGKKGTKVTLTVKKVDGSIQDITITRDIVVLDESYAKSVILNKKGVIDNVGYLRLPKFYADFNRQGGRSCATDVAKEVEKLKKKGVKGIIIDLRNNGGGSLRDVVRMSGLFIEKGPIVQVKPREGAAEILSDYDEKVQYKDPLIIMVNQYSASASEILAAALQDYGRAVIVGGKSTYGKGTVQRFLNLDRAIRGNEQLKPLGQLKLTIQKFYRVNGGSTQLRGVTPDIVLPDNLMYLKVGEKDNDYPLPWTEIEPVEYSQHVTNLSNLPELAMASKERVSHSKIFNAIKANAKRVKERKDQSIYPLSYDKYKALLDGLEKEGDQYDDLFVAIDGLEIHNLKEDLANIEVDEGKKARNDEWLKGLKKDVYIDECLNIMRDMTLSH